MDPLKVFKKELSWRVTSVGKGAVGERRQEAAGRGVYGTPGKVRAKIEASRTFWGATGSICGWAEQMRC